MEGIDTVSADCLSECPSECRCASLDGDADRLVYFTQQDSTFQLFDGDKIAVLAALFVRDILTDLQLPAESIKASLSCLSLPAWLWSRLMLYRASSNFTIYRQARSDCSNFDSIQLAASSLLPCFHLARILPVPLPHLTSC